MRNWFITGVSSGIGAALARSALGRGDTVIGTVRRKDALAPFESLAPGRAHALMLDVEQPEQIAPAVSAAVARAGHIDVVVNNAGRSHYGALEEIALNDAQGLFAANVFGPMQVMQAFLPHLRARGGGSIVNLSSGCGLFGVPGLSAYCASKFALEGLSEALAAEVAPFGIRVMLVEPGAVSGQFISHGTGEAANRLPEYAGVTGMGKAAFDEMYATMADSPEQVAQAILAAVDQPDLPLRLIVGDSVKYGARMKAEAFAALAD
jgi:NAD(P)-dependent dehydrogenase (short-subunit alcohol dehydrogenase family)